MRLRLRGIGGLRRVRRLCDRGLQRLLHVGIARVLLLLLLLLFRLVRLHGSGETSKRARRGRECDSRSDQEPVQARSDGGVLPHWIESRTPPAMVPHAVLRAL
jgi:hypothetical protein